MIFPVIFDQTLWPQGRDHIYSIRDIYRKDARTTQTVTFGRDWMRLCSMLEGWLINSGLLLEKKIAKSQKSSSTNVGPFLCYRCYTQKWKKVCLPPAISPTKLTNNYALMVVIFYKHRIKNFTTPFYKMCRNTKDLSVFDITKLLDYIFGAFVSRSELFLQLARTFSTMNASLVTAVC